MANQMQDAPLEFYYEKYRALDPEEAARRTGLSFDAAAGRFTFSALGFTLYAEWPEFDIVPDNARCPKALTGFAMRIITIRYLLEGAASETSGDFKSYRELPWGELYDRNFQGRCIRRFAGTFGSKTEEFAKAASALGGTPQKLGDAAFDLPFFESVVCRMIIWRPDEEFSASAQILFSDNAPSAFSAEALVAVGEIAIGSLKEACSFSF